MLKGCDRKFHSSFRIREMGRQQSLRGKAAHFVSDLTTVILNPISDKPPKPHPHSTVSLSPSALSWKCFVFYFFLFFFWFLAVFVSLIEHWYGFMCIHWKEGVYKYFYLWSTEYGRFFKYSVIYVGIELGCSSFPYKLANSLARPSPTSLLWPWLANLDSASMKLVIGSQNISIIFFIIIIIAYYCNFLFLSTVMW